MAKTIHIMSHNYRRILQFPRHADLPPGSLPNIVHTFPAPIAVQNPHHHPPPIQAGDAQLQDQSRAVQVQRQALALGAQENYPPDDEEDDTMGDLVDEYGFEDESCQVSVWPPVNQDNIVLWDFSPSVRSRSRPLLLSPSIHPVQH
jgi:hypothetical protein